MMKRKPVLILLSGNLCTGKSTLSDNLARHNGFIIFKSREVLRKLTPTEYISKYATEREGLINYALELDEQTMGSWVADNLSFETIKTGKVVLDCIRLVSQLKALKKKFNTAATIYHVHLKCSENGLMKRFSERDENKRENILISNIDFQQAKEHLIEQQSIELEPYADILISTDSITTDEVFFQVIAKFLKDNVN